MKKTSKKSTPFVYLLLVIITAFGLLIYTIHPKDKPVSFKELLKEGECFIDVNNKDIFKVMIKWDYGVELKLKNPNKPFYKWKDGRELKSLNSDIVLIYRFYETLKRKYDIIDCAAIMYNDVE